MPTTSITGDRLDAARHEPPGLLLQQPPAPSQRRLSQARGLSLHRTRHRLPESPRLTRAFPARRKDEFDALRQEPGAGGARVPPGTRHGGKP